MSSATDELRRMLDERGVEWFESVTRKGLTWIYRDGKAIRFHPWQPDTLKVSMFDLTPERAIAVTLGDMPCLPHWWTHDGKLHTELPRLPESISVRLPDQRDREVSSARVWQYTLGAGTCQLKPWEMERDTGFYDCMECACGYVADVADWAEWRYCPNCGRKVVDE